MLTWCTMPVPGGTTLNWRSASWPQRRKANRSWLRWNSSSTFRSKASGRPNTSATTEWSMTSSAGTSGLILPASPPSARIASRMAARSTTAGTPVRSCISTRAGLNWISVSGSAVGSQLRERGDVVGRDVQPVLGPQQVLQQDLEAVRQVTGTVDGVQPVYLVAGPADGEISAAAEAVPGHDPGLLDRAGPAGPALRCALHASCRLPRRQRGLAPALVRTAGLRQQVSRYQAICSAA